jgi:hypothetical protein
MWRWGDGDVASCDIIAASGPGGRTCLQDPLRAEVAELADALASGASPSNRVKVRVLSSAPHYENRAFPACTNRARGTRLGGDFGGDFSAHQSLRSRALTNHRGSPDRLDQPPRRLADIRAGRPTFNFGGFRQTRHRVDASNMVQPMQLCLLLTVLKVHLHKF